MLIEISGGLVYAMYLMSALVVFVNIMGDIGCFLGRKLEYPLYSVLTKWYVTYPSFIYQIWFWSIHFGAIQ